MPTYPVLDPLKHDGKPCAPGDTVEMDAKAAKELITMGVLGPAVKAAKAETKPAAAGDAKPETTGENAGDGEGSGTGSGDAGEGK